MTQQSIYDQAKERGIELSYKNTSSVWKEEAGAALHVISRRQRFITSEDIITLLEKKGVTTGNNRAIGAVMRSAKRAGLIKPTGEFRVSKLARRHGGPIRVWEVIR